MCSDFFGPNDRWDGVNLGGWLLLEPGPATPLFENHPCSKTKEHMRCEWTLMRTLQKAKGKDGAVEIIRRHRDTHTTEQDFVRIRRCGLNAVRLPVGYWIVTGPTHGDPYVGPALEYVDLALTWAERYGLQVVLDLHGCPGGESGEAPCGFRQRPDGKWKWKQWRREESLAALEILVRRYKDRSCVAGIAVCNEPSESIPSSILIDYYDKAVTLVRKAGMSSEMVAVVLPVFQRDEEEFIAEWNLHTRGRHKNVCFDLHCYHCFDHFSGKSLAQQLRHVEDNAEWFRKHPCVVGEWSLALGQAAWSTCGNMDERSVYKMFGNLQREAYRGASHGSFFWNWAERDDNLEWNFQKAYNMGFLTGTPRPLPRWDGTGEDPLEERLHPSPKAKCVRYGDVVYIRTHYGRYVDVNGCAVNAYWPDKGDWQALEFCPPEGSTRAKEGQVVRKGQVVRLRDQRAGRFLTVSEQEDGNVISRKGAAKPRSEFEVDVLYGDVLHHRGLVTLKSIVTNNFVDADGDMDGLFCRWDDAGDWQKFVVEKQIATPAKKESPKRRQKSSLEPPAKKRHVCQ